MREKTTNKVLINWKLTKESTKLLAKKPQNERTSQLIQLKNA